MKRSSRRLRLWYIAVGAAALLGAVLRTVALLTSFDMHPGYYRTTPITTTLYAVVAAALLLCISLPLFIKKDVLPQDPPPHTMPGVCCAGICALLLLVNFVVACTLRDTFRLPTLLWLLGLVFLLVGVVYFALRFLAERPPLHLTLLCGYGTILAFALLLCYTYFDQFTPMNAPHKVDLHLALLALMFYVLYDLRALAGEAMPRAAAVSTAVAFVLSVTVGISNLVAFAAGVYDSIPYLVQDLLLLSLAAYIGVHGAAAARASIHALSHQEAEVTE